VPRWPAAVALLAIGASYVALSEDVMVGPRAWGCRPHDGVGRAADERARSWLVTTLPGRQASASSVLVDAALIWMSNVVTFAVWYWEVDGGGPAQRRMDVHSSEDFLFPQMAQQDGKQATGWSAGFLDYLFLAFNTSTAFSPTDTAVLSHRVKVLTMVQSLLSLVIVLVLVGWAINTL
jgi:hypothetical protein